MGGGDTSKSKNLTSVGGGVPLAPIQNILSTKFFFFQKSRSFLQNHVFWFIRPHENQHIDCILDNKQCYEVCIFKQRTSSTRHYSNSGSYTNIHQSLFLSFSAFCPIINKAENLELILFQFQKDTQGCALETKHCVSFLSCQWHWNRFGTLGNHA